MGGSVQRDVGTKMTQLLAASSLGDKYQYATTFSIPVLTEEWLAAAWDGREVVGRRAATKQEYTKYRLPLFKGNAVHFHGFDADELRHMKEVLVENGGRVVGELGARDTTHIVMDENSSEGLPEGVSVPDGCHLVTGEWFWNSIQIEAAADVSAYRWRAGGAGLLSPSISVFSPPLTPGGSSATASNKKRKRRRRAEMIQSLAAGSPAHKRRSSVTELAHLNMSGSFLDNTDRDRTGVASPDPSPVRGAEVGGEARVGAGQQGTGEVKQIVPITPRQQVKTVPIL